MNHFPHMMSFMSELRKETKMYDFEEINVILNQMADEGIVEPMVEPIDEADCHPMDFADVTGLFDEMYPEPQEMVDENGTVWYVA